MLCAFSPNNVVFTPDVIDEAAVAAARVDEVEPVVLVHDEGVGAGEHLAVEEPVARVGLWRSKQKQCVKRTIET